MDVEAYRKAYETELSGAEQPDDAGGAPFRGMRSLRSTTFAERIDLDGGGIDGDDAFGAHVKEMLATLRSSEAPAPGRLAALKELQVARFLGEHFAPFRAEFLQALREVAQSETDAELRESALATLSAEKDGATEQLLRDGLTGTKQAMVSPLKALQMLSLNDHADIAPLAADIFHRSDDLPTKEAALRVLSTDPGSQDLLQNLLTDKSQARSLRAMSATGLNLLNPTRFADVAKTIVNDTADFEDIRASALGALASTTHEPLRNDKTFLDEVRTLGAQDALGNLNAAANRFLSR